jgi:3-methylcrotonyl-CoA carboxylase alpha subunit
MPGLVVDIKVRVGDEVKKGDKLLVLEAMKTQQSVTAPFDGTVEAINVDVGDQVVEGILMLRVKPA